MILTHSFPHITLILLTWKIKWAPNNDSKWQMGFNWAFKRLIILYLHCLVSNDRGVRIAHHHTGWQINETHTIVNKQHQLGNCVKISTFVLKLPSRTTRQCAVLLSSGSVLTYVEKVLLAVAYIAVLVSSVLIRKYSLTYITTEEETLFFKNVVTHFLEGKDDIQYTIYIYIYIYIYLMTAEIS